MPITLRTKTVFHCRCIRPECGHEWDALTKPHRCAKCKYRSWNGEDHRRPDPYDDVPYGSDVETGTKAPRSPSYESMLESFLKARAIIEDLINSNPCNHSKDECVCAEKEALAEIDQHIARLRALESYLMRRSLRLRKKQAAS